MAMTLAKIAGSETAFTGDGETIIAGLTADSREVKPGYLFAALPGTKVDGAKFIPQALKQGAVAILHGKDAEVQNNPDTCLIASDNPRQTLARLAARFYGQQPETIVAVTGTNGKTSVASFVRQIWEIMGFAAASLGTTGVDGPNGHEPLQHTTPDPVQLHQSIARLCDAGTTHLALEASSHGLAQYRLDGLRFSAGAFTNLSRDHLDYHADFDEYLAAKLRLFSELLRQASSAVINADSPHAGAVRDACKANEVQVFNVGRKGEHLKLVKAVREGFGQLLEIETADGRNHRVVLPLVGEFQASNALVAAGLVIASGGQVDLAIRSLERLRGAPGRLELVAHASEGAPIFVDYAHTPDALDNALEALKPYVSGKLAVVFGAGGDRDPGKRELMGQVAAAKADLVYVTDDNPRSEDPAAIRREILKGCPDAIDAGEREKAIHRAVNELAAGDVLLVAGKGHEPGQTIGDTTYPFSDHDAVIEAAGGKLDND